MSIKEAISKDPVQQKLRTNKALWNKACSELITRIIAFKKGLNGRGDTKYGLPPSTIKEPLPTETGAFLNQLANDFEQIVNGANKIITEQESYSKTRRRSHKEAAISLSELSVIGSTRMSRLWTYLKSPLRFWDEYRRHKVSMLALCADIRYKMLEFQGELVSRDTESILNAAKIFQTLNFKMKALYDMINVLEQTQNKILLNKIKESPQSATPNEKSAPQIVEPRVDPKQDSQIRKHELIRIKNDLALAPRLEWPSKIESITKISEKLIDYKNKIDYLDENKRFSEIVKLYFNAIKDCLDHYNIAGPLNPDGTTTFKDIVKFVNAKKAQSANNLIKVSSNFISRWLKKKLHQLTPFDKTSSMRVQVFEGAEIFKKELNEVMNILEKSKGAVDLKQIQQKMNNLIDIKNNIDKDLQVLNTMYMETYYAKLMGPEGKDPFGQTMQRKLKTDISKKFI